ncbi:hypothetical protein PIROE2DRAFT_11484, partial [Piromyces sp. E2]
KLKNILSNESLENEISEEFILYYNVPTYSSSKSKKLEKDKILVPSHIIGFCIQKIIEYDLFIRLKQFTSKIIANIKYVTSKNINDRYFWLSNVFELKCVVETIYNNEKEIREKDDIAIVSDVLKCFNDLVTEIYNMIWKSLSTHIKNETQLKATKINDPKKDIVYYLKRSYKKLKFFYNEDAFNDLLLEEGVNLICTSWYSNYTIKRNSLMKKYETRIQDVERHLQINYITVIQENSKKIYEWLIQNKISMNSSCESLLQSISKHNTNSLTDEKIMLCFTELKINDICFEFEIPSYRKIKKLKVKNVPNSAYLTSTLFELKV